MTDKQIIIDGVDVSGCEFYTNDGWCCYALVYEKHCKDCSNCMYKLKRQLEAKAHECEMLKLSEKSLTETIENIARGFEELKSDNKHLNDLLNQSLKELEQSREAVEKIKAIAEKNLNIHTCAFKGCGYDLITKQILQICDEVNE